MAFTAGAPSLQLGSSFTMETWVYFETLTPYAFIMGKPHQNRHADPYMSYCLELNSEGKVEFAQSTGVTGSYRTATAPSQPPLRTWMHIAGTLSAGTIRLYVNGVEVASMASAGAPSTSLSVPFTLGAGAGPDTSIQASGFAGALRQARVWNAALSASEIQSRAAQTLTGTETGLIACWPLDDGSGTAARVIGTPGLTMTLGDRSGQNRPSWIASGFLDSLGIFTDAIALPFSVGISNPQDLIPFDYDGDNDLDVIVTGLVWPPTIPGTVVPFWFLKNDGSGQFTRDTSDWTRTLGLVHPRHWHTGDFNQDGRQDIVIVGHGTDVNPFPGEVSLLLIRKADGTVQSLPASMPTADAFTHNVAVADIDKDLDLDVYMCNIGGGTVGPQLLRNNGSGVFAAGALGLPSDIAIRAERYTSSIFADVDNDGDPDLILGGHDGASAWTPTDKLLLNDGSGTFTPAPAGAMPVRPLGNASGSVGLAVADVDNDGWIDIIASVHSDYRIPTIQLLLNNGNGTFRDASANIPQQWPTSASFGNSWIRWTLPIDLNSDGWIDFVSVGQNECPSAVYLNTGGGTFRQYTDYYLDGKQYAALTTADFTGDSKPDLLAVRSGGATVLYKTVGNAITTSVGHEDVGGGVADTYQLGQNYPNPFNPATVISYTVAAPSVAEERSVGCQLSIFDLLGREVAVLVNEVKPAGVHHATWDASGMPSGIYFYRLMAGKFTQTRKLLLMR
jgi:hypothetical protein